MADFEELKLTVSLVDDASTGLASLRTQVTQLAQAADVVGGAFARMSSGVQQAGQVQRQATPHIISQERALNELARSAEETSRGILQMGLAARRGAEAFPELALATREAWTGLKGVNAGMAELGAASRLMVVGLGAVAIGIGAVGAAVAAYGISVFKFSREMYTLSQTAKSLGMTFGQLKNITEQNEAFGVSVDTTIGQLGRMQGALADLSVSGSKLRQQMIGMGVPPQRIDEIVRETDAVERANKIRSDQIKITEDLQKRMGKEAATEWGKRYAGMWGADPTAPTRPPLEHQTKEEEEASARIAKQSEEIATQWAKIYKIVSDIKTEFLAWGLPGVLSTLKQIVDLWTTWQGVKKKAEEGGTTSYLGGAVKIDKNSEFKQWVDQSGWAAKLKSWGVLGDNYHIGAPDEAAPQGTPEPANENLPPSQQRGPRRPAESLAMGYSPVAFREGFSGGGGSSSEGRARGIIKGGVYDALIEFYSFLQTGRAGSGGGVQNANFGGSAGAAGERAPGAAGFGGGGYKNLGSGNVIPSDQEMDAKDKAWLGGGRVGGQPHGSHVGAGAGDGAGESPAGGAGGGDHSKVGNEFLASQRARLKKELDNDPELKRRAAAIIQRENPGAGTAVIESAMNRAAMTGRSLRSILSGGPKSFYGPARVPGMIEGTMHSMSAKDLAARYRQIDEATAGSNVVKGYTDQGSAGDPNFVKGGTGINMRGGRVVPPGTPGAERFNDWGVAGSRRWREAQQAQVNKSAVAAAETTKASEEVKASATVPGAGAGGGPGPVSERYSTRALNGFDETDGGQGGSDASGAARPKRIIITRQPHASLDRGALDLDRGAVDRQNGSTINSTGKLSVDVKAPAGTKVAYNGNNLLKNTSMQRQTQMVQTSMGPGVGDSRIG